MQNPSTQLSPATRWLNEKQVAAMTGISRSTLQKHRLYRTGIPYSKIGSSVRYCEQAVLDFMMSRTVPIL